MLLGTVGITEDTSWVETGGNEKVRAVKNAEAII
jgi:hypothetical protein